MNLQIAPGCQELLPNK